VDQYNALSAYRETRVKTAGQGQLIVMLYDGAIKNLDRALDLLKAEKAGKKNPANIEIINNAILKAKEIITELMVSLDFEKGGEIAKYLFSLYTWFNKELLEGTIKRDPCRFTVVRNMLSELKSAWEKAASERTAKTEQPAKGLNIAG
jgi:flagellar protein FliS